jgi:hypothetical protein
MIENGYINGKPSAKKQSISVIFKAFDLKPA